MPRRRRTSPPSRRFAIGCSPGCTTRLFTLTRHEGAGRLRSFAEARHRRAARLPRPGRQAAAAVREGIPRVSDEAPPRRYDGTVGTGSLPVPLLVGTGSLPVPLLVGTGSLP